MSESKTDERVAELERKVERLTQLLEASGSSASRDAGPTGVASVEVDEPVTRRAALRTAGVLAAGAIAGGVGMVASATPAAAATASYTADGSNPALSVEAASGQSAIRATSTNTGTTPTINVASGVVGVNVVASACAVQGSVTRPDLSPEITVGGNFNAALGVYAWGYRNALDRGGIGALCAGQTGALQLYPLNSAPANRVHFTNSGVIDIDTNGDVWLCTGEGTPGTWRKISGPSAAGAFHAIAPVRAYDSRKSAYTLNGTIANSTNRTVSVADSHATSDGTLVTSGVVPAGATAVAANVTVAGTTGTGYFCINPGGTTTLGASTINWFGAGQTIANGVILALDANRQVTIVAGNAIGSAHCIIDVTGYWL